jgi:hypothetical protein
MLAGIADLGGPNLFCSNRPKIRRSLAPSVDRAQMDAGTRRLPIRSCAAARSKSNRNVCNLVRPALAGSDTVPTGILQGKPYLDVRIRL